ncbi:Type IV secretion system protein VirB2 [Candidatus Trichorickettsia mobilis]|uniref:Type IV secretion system protein VirB2 n=1 Tax=Candidatus Trichorickettsia mobilis TaxID=1346319 RepID=A0ABZ0UTA9_9RICK|nr:TrbC/VirB2 family protein [Candidatus Trichorickettsia mobilis]WPY00841.1 Type IV secretion system protein VirB2 [Candidatus Trichorickettsia mobilis]
MNFLNFRLELDRDLVWHLFLALCTISLVLMMTDVALASASTSLDPNDVVGATLCRLVKNLSGGIARGIATLAIFAVGVGLFLGKLNWGIAAATAAGVGIIFSAPKLVGFLSGDGNLATCPVS